MAAQHQMPSLKFILVGDGAVGKTCLLATYTSGKCPEEYIPTVFENQTVNLKVNDEDYEIQLWDTAGQEDYDRLRPLSYPQTDVFILCFSLVEEASLTNVSARWVPELRHHCPNAPFILVGTKSDLRDDKETVQKLSQIGKEPINKSKAKKVAKQVKASRYLECSAKANKGIQQVFDAAVQAAVQGNTSSGGSQFSLCRHL